MKKKRAGYFHYGLSSIDRYKNFFKAIKHNSGIVIAQDAQVLTLNYCDGETLPVWLSIEEAQAALPNTEWPSFDFDTFTCAEFIVLYQNHTENMYVSIRPNSKGVAKTITLDEFLLLISENI